MRLGVSVDGFRAASATCKQAQAAEAGGADVLWIASHLFQRDPISLAAVALASTHRLKVGLMAMSPYAMHPVHIAMAAATLAELHPTRVLLSLGVGAPALLRRAGIEAHRPLAAVSEALTICRGLLRGEPVHREGSVFRIDHALLANGGGQIPILLAASGPRMLDLAGAQADGVIVSGGTSLGFVRWCADRLRAAGGDAPTCHGIVYVAPPIPRIGQADALRRNLAFILRGEHHRHNIALSGTAIDQARLREALEREDWPSVEALIPDEALAAFSASGHPPGLRARLAEYAAAGLDTVVLGGLNEPDELETVLGTLTAHQDSR